MLKKDDVFHRRIFAFMAHPVFYCTAHLRPDRDSNSVPSVKMGRKRCPQIMGFMSEHISRSRPGRDGENCTSGSKGFSDIRFRLPLKIKARAALPHPVVHAILDLLFILLIRQIIQNLLVQSSGDEEFSRHPKLRMNSASRTNMKPLMVNSDTGTLARYSSVKSDDGRVSIHPAVAHNFHQHNH
ncbi:hypothetical protein [Leclercia adecarboxylata]|uniref:hypothetical protein n=1 Tax=Leclercia adecarboxylata TaxID=83655 RepID=UPI00159BB508|nr:hypothetical protein [Leclercia adecarboxylata]